MAHLDLAYTASKMSGHRFCILADHPPRVMEITKRVPYNIVSSMDNVR